MQASLRVRGAVVAAWACVALLQAFPAHAEEREAPFVVAGVGAGVLFADIANPEKPSDTFGASFRTRFDIGFRPQRWLELGFELGLTHLGASDSVNATLEARDLPGDAAYTLVDWNVGARVLLASWGSWTPWVRGALGQAWLRLSAPQPTRAEDLAWVAGAGIDFEPWRGLLFRGEAGYLGVNASPVANSIGMDVGIFYALRRSQFD